MYWCSEGICCLYIQILLTRCTRACTTNFRQLYIYLDTNFLRFCTIHFSYILYISMIVGTLIAHFLQQCPISNGKSLQIGKRILGIVKSAHVRIWCLYTLN